MTAVAVLWAATVTLWLLDAAGRGLPAALDRGVAGLALVATGALAGGALFRLWRQGAAGRLLLGLLALALVACFTGLDHELTTRYFGDEGIYLAQAQRINEHGQLLRPRFVYPHLLFYLDALALWLASQLGPAVPALAALLYGVEGEPAVAALVTRGVTALLGALTVVPVFVAARRLAGLFAAGVAGGLAVLSPLYLEVAHINISDVPGAFFAAMTVMQCALMLDGESRRGYLLAGLWAGLAAGGKYPAGVVAVAIAAVWLRWRLAERRWGWGVVLAAVAAGAAFLATTPSILAFPEAVYTGGGTDILFGVRQYARGGWPGVVRASNLAYYWRELRLDLGLPAILLGAAGVAGLGPRERARLLWLAAFPAAFLGLLLAMRISVARNLLPVLPALAVLLGAGAAGWLRWLEGLGRERPGGLGGPAVRRGAAALLAVLVLALPAWRSLVEVVRFARPTTRDLAAAWIRDNVPPGAFFVQEDYTPKLLPPEHYPSIQKRFVIRFADERLRHPYHDFLLVAGGSYNRFLHGGGAFEYQAGRYREIFETFPLVKRWPPSRFRLGSEVRLYRVDPLEPPWVTGLGPSLEGAVVSEAALRDEPTGQVRFRAPGDWVMVKGFLEPGRYRIRLDADLPRSSGGPAEVRVSDREAREIDRARLTAEGVGHVRLPERRKYFLYVSLPEGSVLRGLTVRRQASRLMPPGTGGTAPRPAPGPRRGAGRRGCRLGRCSRRRSGWRPRGRGR
ncbi:MAG TPA: glycosyltransferase family 39 protein [Thermoanaerobaculia bacterium]|nr:glycosyltransferase family 39 protein [Thermoanaerobaculia bacterium]